ncbi:hypothetical protein EDB84DRAFT_1678734 [Lactarius hengduanensis]|nr:hypothetical protein EDB84DRAFT_1678734 [Lactarius hengduanensis]
MPPRPFADILASTFQKPERAAPENTPSSFKEEILSFDTPLDPTCGLGTRASVMTPASFGVYSFQSVYLGQQPRPNQLDNSPAQSCFALEGSSAAARRSRRKNLNTTVPWNQGLDFKLSNRAERQKTGERRKSENNRPSTVSAKKQKVSDALAIPTQANTTSRLQPGGQGPAAGFDPDYGALSDTEKEPFKQEKYKRRDATNKVEAVANKENRLEPAFPVPIAFDLKWIVNSLNRSGEF